MQTDVENFRGGMLTAAVKRLRQHYQFRDFEDGGQYHPGNA